MTLVKEKIKQAKTILNELDIDMWLTLCRESDTVPDPVIDLIVGQKVIWTSAYIIPRSGKNTVLVGTADASDYQLSGLYDQVVVYDDDVGVSLREILAAADPKTIAVNFAKNNVTADGLSHGLYLLLLEWLENTPYRNRLMSAEGIISRLRGRKNETELQRIKTAAEMAARCWKQSIGQIRPGMSEIRIGEIIDGNIRKLGGRPSFETVVNAGAKTQPGHGSPTGAVLEKGDLLHVDFGVRHQDFCSDIQRVAYFKHDMEDGAPLELSAAFDLVNAIIDKTAGLYRSGAIGHEIDAVARNMLLEKGYPEYPHGLGHQIGRAVHDGASIVGPLWKRYGEMPRIALESGNTFTVELGIQLESIGYVGLEEDLLVTDEGGIFLSPRQTELPVL